MNKKGKIYMKTNIQSVQEADTILSVTPLMKRKWKREEQREEHDQESMCQLRGDTDCVCVDIDIEIAEIEHRLNLIKKSI